MSIPCPTPLRMLSLALMLCLAGCAEVGRATQSVQRGMQSLAEHLTPPPAPADNTAIAQLRPRAGHLLVFMANAADATVAFQVGERTLPRTERGTFVLAEIPAGPVAVYAITAALLRNRVVGETRFEGPDQGRIFLVLAQPRTTVPNPLDSALVLTGGPDPTPFFANYRLNPAQSDEIQRIVDNED
jgi:hypothetical protein